MSADIIVFICSSEELFHKTVRFWFFSLFYSSLGINIMLIL